MDILLALQQSQTKEIQPEQHDYITDAVWEATLYRLGEDITLYSDITHEEREFILEMIEDRKNDRTKQTY